MSPSRDRALVDALTAMVCDLRSCQLGAPRRETRGALSGAADRFVGKLADHLRYTEEILFPTLREIEPGASHVIERMKKGHRDLGGHLKDLAVRIKAEDDDGAYDVARSFLATALDHFGSETAVLGGIVRSLDDKQTRLLTEALTSRS